MVLHDMLFLRQDVLKGSRPCRSWGHVGDLDFFLRREELRKQLAAGFSFEQDPKKYLGFAVFLFIIPMGKPLESSFLEDLLVYFCVYLLRFLFCTSKVPCLGTPGLPLRRYGCQCRGDGRYAEAAAAAARSGEAEKAEQKGNDVVKPMII